MRAPKDVVVHRTLVAAHPTAWIERRGAWRQRARSGKRIASKPDTASAMSVKSVALESTLATAGQAGLGLISQRPPSTRRASSGAEGRPTLIHRCGAAPEWSPSRRCQLPVSPTARCATAPTTSIIGPTRQTMPTSTVVRGPRALYQSMPFRETQRTPHPRRKLYIRTFGCQMNVTTRTRWPMSCMPLRGWSARSRRPTPTLSSQHLFGARESAGARVS